MLQSLSILKNSIQQTISVIKQSLFQFNNSLGAAKYISYSSQHLKWIFDQSCPKTSNQNVFLS